MQKKYLLLFILVAIQTSLFAQFKIDQLPSDLDQLKDSLFFGITKTRSIQNLNKSWKVFFVDEMIFCFELPELKTKNSITTITKIVIQIIMITFCLTRTFLKESGNSLL